MFDSFGRSVGSGSGFSNGDSGADGGGGDGAPIANGTVLITDASGKSVSAVTDSYGYFRAKINGFSPPFVAQITKADGTVRYSLSINPVKTNGFITINISGLTDKIASDVAVAGGKSGASQLTPLIISSNVSTIAQSVANIVSVFGSVIGGAGLSASTFDPLSAPFVANHTGYDNVLDNTVVTKSSSGATVLTPAPVYIQPAVATPVTQPSTITQLPGNWQANNTITPITSPATTPITNTLVVSGSAVPASAAALTDFYVVSAAITKSLQSLTSILPAGTRFSFDHISTTANTVSVTERYADAVSSTVINEVDTYSNYLGCGSCGVGSTVSFSMSSTYTGTSTSGSTVTPTSGSLLGTYSYTRIN